MTVDGAATRSASTSEPRIEVGRSVAGVDPADIEIAAHGSPLHVYDATAVRARVIRLKAALPGGVDVAYAVKANASPGVLSELLRSGLGADVASAGELRAVLRAGFEPRSVVFTGPGKTDAEIEAALEAGVGSLTIESLDELGSVIARAPLAMPGQGLMFRLSASGAAEAITIITGDASAKFGMTDDEADTGLDRLRASGTLAPAGPFHFRGFHAFGASNVLEADELVGGVVALATRAEMLSNRHDLRPDLLDGGGGLGIPYAEDERPLDVHALGRGLAAELATWTERPSLSSARLLLEPGRWLVGPVGAYLCSVVRTKERPSGTIAITDGGIHHLLRPRLVGQDHRVVPVGEAATRPSEISADVVGPLCTGLDLLARSVPSPVPRHGDVYAVLDTGAYGYAESMPFFLSHPIPAEIIVDGANVALSRARLEPESILGDP